MYKSADDLKKFKFVDKEVLLFKNALILRPEMIEISSGVRIDDYARVEGGKGLFIGQYVHISSFAGILGGGEAIIEEYCAMAQGARLLTGSDQATGVMSAAAPNDIRDAFAGKTILKKHAFLGANSVVMPNVVIGEGAVVGAGAVVTKDVEPWTIVAGVPAKPISKREVIDLEKLRNR